MANWTKKDEALIERVVGLLSTAPVRRKNIFGTAAWFLESNDMMFIGAWGSGIMVRIGEERTSDLIESGGAEQFDPMGGRPMCEYVFIDTHLIAEDDELLGWLNEASDFAGTLPPRKKR